MSRVRRRDFVGGLAASVALPGWNGLCPSSGNSSCQGAEQVAIDSAQWSGGAQLSDARPGEDIIAFVKRHRGSHDERLYCQILGAANDFKEGDHAIGVAASDERSRQLARRLLEKTSVHDIDTFSPHQDSLFSFIRSSVDPVGTIDAGTGLSGTGLSGIAVDGHPTIGDLRSFLLSATAEEIQKTATSLSSDVIGCVVKLMSNDELVSVGAKVFNVLPGSQIGSRGYLGARVQPNSPTDNVDDIRWQVFNAWSYAVGDVLLGTNPVSSTPESVAAVELTLQDLLVTFALDDVLPHCVLSHVDVQAAVEQLHPGSTELWFQSIAGCDSANKTFDISVEKMRQYALTRSGRFGLYFETGQGADFTNGHGHGFDMVIHESRKYGFARALTKVVAESQRRAGGDVAPWVHLNDVAGFIGPEVFRTREQLVRCCLEDIVMGKLHGLCIGLDVCSTLHMDVSLADLDWCIDQIMPANPAYLMALPTKIDPMLGYLTTGFQDHVRIRHKFGYRVNDRMWLFFQELGVIDVAGRPTKHFGDPAWVYLQYQRKKGDSRPETDVAREAATQLAQIRERGVFIANGHGENAWDLEPSLARDIQRIYADAKQSIWAELPGAFIATIPDAVELRTLSADRTDYILHPISGEQLDESSTTAVATLRRSTRRDFNVQIVISDGLNALSISDDEHLSPFLDEVRSRLAQQGFHVARESLVVRSGRVRAGYRIGEILFGGAARGEARSDSGEESAERQDDMGAILHVIGERPGTGHHTFSVYITAANCATWSKPGTIDHDITKVVSGIATTALEPVKGAIACVELLRTLS